ncbi:MAG: response regulator transcription factor [Elusimicrobia bacterium]|nr:response regulator transcription factor [Elusimicrobiota bacterium]
MHRKKILVADDDEEWRDLLLLWLTKPGYRLFFARNGQEVAGLAERHRPDCIVLDFELGDLSAVEVCRKLKSNPRSQAIPIIVLTAHTDKKLATYNLCQADHFISKIDGGQEELKAILGSTFRRLNWDNRVLEKDDIKLDPVSRRVYRSERPVTTLSSEQFHFLYILVERSPGYISHAEVAKLILHHGHEMESTDVIRSLAHRMRRELGSTLGRRIRSLKGIGWLYLLPTRPKAPLRRLASS